ncbi:hypothetical protein ACHQM5_025208 [Ranunculus cassubicifolius]
MGNSRLNTIAIFIVFFYVLLSFSVMAVDATSRPLNDHHNQWRKGLTAMAKAYSGPSHGGKGH